MITPLGGKTSLGTSSVVAGELKAFVEYREATFAVMAKHGGAINSEAAAHDLRTVIAAYMPLAKATMQTLKFTF
jgi:hypothetical protein